MSVTSEGFSSSYKMSCNATLTTLEKTLQQNLSDCKDLTKYFEELSIESEDYKRQYNIQKEKCESNRCSSSEALKKVIESKEKLLQLIASALTMLYESKNFSILSEIMKILNDEAVLIHKTGPSTEIKEEIIAKKEVLSPVYDDFIMNVKDIKQEVPCEDESVLEIEGTPTTGRTSPIIQPRKTRNGSSYNLSDSLDKKKCPENWPTPENKIVKLTFSTPSTSKPTGRLKQSRLNLVKVKSNSVVDLTRSPKLMRRNSQNSDSPLSVQPLVKKESTDNDDTILPSPTSGPTHFPSLLKASSKCSPMKYKRPPLCLRPKSEAKPTTDLASVKNSPVKPINILNKEDSNQMKPPIRFMKSLDENSPIKMQPMDEDETRCDIPSSLSILQLDAIDQMENNKKIYSSPTKRPLAENINITNQPYIDSSMSLLRPEPKVGKTSPPERSKSPILNQRNDPDIDNSVSLLPRDEKICKKSPSDDQRIRRKIPEPVQPVYKEVLPRKKSEKRNLPGWSCDECEHFYAELYRHDPAMLADKMEECSRHRGRAAPTRPRTPPGFWQPRWSVPDDTDDFNRRNDAA